MDRIQSSGPDDAPALGEQVDVEAAAPAESAVPDEATTTAQIEEDDLGGTGGISAGGAG